MGPLLDAAASARRALAGLSDMERTLARLAASAGVEGGVVSWTLSSRCVHAYAYAYAGVEGGVVSALQPLRCISVHALCTVTLGARLRPCEPSLLRPPGVNTGPRGASRRAV